MKPSRDGITLYEGSLKEFSGKTTNPPALQIAKLEGLALLWDYEPAERILVLNVTQWGDDPIPAIQIPLTEAEAAIIHNYHERGGWGYYDLHVEENDDRAALQVSFINESQVPTNLLWIINKKRRTQVRKALNSGLDYDSRLSLK